MKKGIKIIIVFLLLLVAFYAIYTFYPKNTYSTNPIADEITINNPEETSRVLKVLLIETDPIITQVAGTELTSGKKASELLGFDKQVALNELIEDLEYTSHGYLTINIYKTEYLNEFPTYTKSYTYPNETKYDSNGNPIDVNYGETITDEIILPDGRTGYRYNEAKYVQNGYNTSTKKLDWWQLYRKKYFDSSFSQENSSYSFDYKYIIDKFNLINRRNNGEFDQVWLMGIDSTYSYETIMVGNNPYWTNAPGYIADCPNFLIGGASMSRRDAQFHALGHGVESIMRAAFHRSYSNYTDYTKTGTYKYYRVQYDTYSSDAISISTKEEYDQLNLWEKFNLSDYNNAGTYQSVGTVHHPFNARNGYDYNNSNQVYTNWRDWYDYPSFNNSLQLDNQSAWMNHSINNLLGEGEEKDPDRLYMRMWFYLMPHSTGYTEDGHLNNWWKYFTTLDFVAGLTENDTQSLVVLKGDKVRINLTLNYNSLNTDTVTYIKSGNNIQIGNSTILGYTEDGYLYAKKKGNTTVTLNYDGKLITYNVKVVYDNTVTLNGNGATTNGTASITAIYNSSTLTPTSITLPKREYTITYNANGTNITMPSNGKVTYSLVGWYTSQSGGSKILNNEVMPAYEKKTVNGYIENSKWIGTEDKILYAQWTAGNITLANITKTGYSCHWNTKSDGSGTSYNSGEANYTTNSDVILYAICENNQYDVIFNANGGQGTMNSISVPYNTEIQLPQNEFTYTDYIFLNWNTEIDGTGTTIANKATIINLTQTNEIILYAQWQARDLVINNSGSFSVDEDNMTIRRVNTSTTIDQLIDSITTTASITISDANNESITERNYLKTGDILKIANDSNYVTYTILVTGDVDGNGIVNKNDAKIIAKYVIKNKTNINEKYILAGDINNDHKLKMNDVIKTIKMMN